MVNRTVVLEPNTTQQFEQRLACNLLDVVGSNCSLDKLRFYATTVWAATTPQLKWSGASMIAFIDRIFNLTRSFKPNGILSYLELYLSDWYSSVQTLTGYHSFRANLSNYTLNLINSKSLRIDCNVRYSNRTSRLFLDSINITVFLGRSSSPPSLNFVIRNHTIPAQQNG